MTALAFFEHPLWSRLAAMHWHFLWQGLLIACLYWAVVRLFNIHSARIRYLLGMSGLAAMMLATFATFWLADVPKPRFEPMPQVAASVSTESPSPSLLPLGDGLNDAARGPTLHRPPHPNPLPPGERGPE